MIKEEESPIDSSNMDVNKKVVKSCYDYSIMKRIGMIISKLNNSSSLTLANLKEFIDALQLSGKYNFTIINFPLFLISFN